MKTILLFTFLFLIGYSSNFAQERKENKDKSPGKASSLKNLPDKSEVSTIALQSIFHGKQGETVSIRLNEELTVTGTIVEKVTHNSGTTAVNLKSNDYPGVLFNFSSSKGRNGEEVIQARILSRQSPDALVLIKENNRYFLKHTPQDKLIAE
ncbi:MAG TPA: hypothetical protein VLC28_16275 [Flavitalea sp.]|nr:hypothetical protein [Flavitalea sp.]